MPLPFMSSVPHFSEEFSEFELANPSPQSDDAEINLDMDMDSENPKPPGHDSGCFEESDNEGGATGFQDEEDEDENEVGELTALFGVFASTVDRARSGTPFQRNIFAAVPESDSEQESEDDMEPLAVVQEEALPVDDDMEPVAAPVAQVRADRKRKGRIDDEDDDAEKCQRMDSEEESESSDAVVGEDELPQASGFHSYSDAYYAAYMGVVEDCEFTSSAY